MYVQNYSEEQLCRAYEEVKSELSIRHAAERYGIPKSTLSERITGRVQFGSHSGPQRYLSDEEERELVSFICLSVRIGYAKTKKEVLAIVEQVVALKGRDEVRMDGGYHLQSAIFEQLKSYPTHVLWLVMKI